MSSLNKKPLLVGLTGGIGSGKTVVSNQFENMGIPCFYADKVAGTYYNDKYFCEKLYPIFGDVVFDENGVPNKRKIAEIVFSNPDKLQQLNAIVHPKVMSDFETWVALHADSPYVIQENAILFEHGFEMMFDKTIMVYAPKDLRIRRVLKRDKTTYEAVEARINNQMDDEEKRKKSDYVILNYKGEKYRTSRIEKVHKKILEFIAQKS